MDDQFNGRTDDDLFADDFEPVPSPSPEAQEARGEAIPAQPGDAPSKPGGTRPQPSKPVLSSNPPPKSLAQSRHNKPPAPSSRGPRQQQQPSTTMPSVATTTQSTPAPAATSAPATTAQTPAATPQPVPKDSAASPPAKPSADARLTSGANPRTKPTDEELAAKMEKMRILSAEKARRFEQAERDERDHAIIYARGMEEARRRRVVEDEKRKRGEEDRRRMEEERARNRERKLKAIGLKEGGWDEGKDEEEDRRGFRGANGGVRGARGGGLAGSRYAGGSGQADGEDDMDMYIWNDGRGRGRGRGRGGFGRGGRGGRGSYDGFERNSSLRDDAPTQPRNGGGRGDKSQPVLSPADFPALPSSGPKKAEAPAKITAPPLHSVVANPVSPLSPPIGKWDDEMAAMDAKAGKS